MGAADLASEILQEGLGAREAGLHAPLVGGRQGKPPPARLCAFADDLQEASFLRGPFAEEGDEEVVGLIHPLAVIVGDWPAPS